MHSLFTVLSVSLECDAQILPVFYYLHLHYSKLSYFLILFSSLFRQYPQLREEQPTHAENVDDSIFIDIYIQYILRFSLSVSMLLSFSIIPP
jgi:hypothetical protein